jgi:hypothetical protein
VTPEGRIQSYLKRRIAETGGHQRKLQWIGRRGAPDLFVWWDGPRLWFVEVKSETGRLSALQELEIGRLRASGFRVRVVDSMSAVDAFIAEAEETA